MIAPIAETRQKSKNKVAKPLIRIKDQTNGASVRLPFLFDSNRRRMWARRDLNPHTLRYQNLNLACLPFHH